MEEVEDNKNASPESTDLESSAPSSDSEESETELDPSAPCIAKCENNLEKTLNSIPPKTESEIEIETTVQPLFEKYNAAHICKDIKKINKKNVKREKSLQKAEQCETKCKDSRKKGGADVSDSFIWKWFQFLPSFLFIQMSRLLFKYY